MLMNNIYLTVNSGKEDYYEVLGTREDLDSLKKGKVTYVVYPGSEKTVGITLRESDDPDSELKDVIKAGKRSEIKKNISFIVIAGLTIYGGITLVQNIIGVV